ncbi:MAG: hypothetical protein ACJ73E_17680 [Mycobacteriales bacterium]
MTPALRPAPAVRGSRSGRAGPRAAALAATGLLAAAGCGSGGTGSTAATAAAPTTPAATALTATCADRATAVPVPAEFPADFPLPPRTVVTSVERRSGDRLVLTGVSPDPFRTVLRHLQTALPKAGLRLDGGEVEEQDAESDYAGPRYAGRWTLRTVPGCDADTLVTVLVAPPG